MYRHEILITTAILFFVASLTSCYSDPRGSRPCQDLSAIPGSNVLLITLDTTRADALGCYGGPEWVTHNLNELAQQGVRFDRTFTVAPLTLPAHATILTGLLPFEHGVRDNATSRLPEDVTTIAERMKAEGYSTFAVIGAFALHSVFGLDQGFDLYADVSQCRLTLGAAGDRRSASEVVDSALKILRESPRNKPVFLWAHFFDPHVPYHAPETASTRSSGRDRAWHDATLLNEESRHDYLREVRFMDHEIGRLIRGVQCLLPADELLTAVVADHGEGLGDHGERTHALQIYDSTIRVPMILHHYFLPRGEVVSDPVSTQDLAPTLLALLGIDPEGMSGRILSPLFGPGDALRGSNRIYIETAYPFLKHNWSPLYGLVDWPYKLIDGPIPELFDLAQDPGEERNIIAQHGEIAERLRGGFAELIERMERSQRLELSRANESRLEALGYVGSEESANDHNPLIPGRIMANLRDPSEGMKMWDRCVAARSLVVSTNPADSQKALVIIRDMLEHDPDDPTLLAHAGSIFFRTKRYSEAVEVLERSLELLESPTTRDTLASCYSLLGQAGRGLEILRTSVELHPFDLASRFKLGEALLRQGEADDAMIHLDFFLRHHAARDELHKRVEILMRTAERMSS